ncbi:hypothetical protein E2C01_097239 [Portunus trituberculatus]|uniref:Uncharacterized protein n=1 Tax=Portunus trituberculatus TaxID=210409 RepID=A0A5B7K9F6_PORTR|nr:hypothetical protein [Portunus trituberculatus]
MHIINNRIFGLSSMTGLASAQER